MPFFHTALYLLLCASLSFSTDQTSFPKFSWTSNPIVDQNEHCTTLDDTSLNMTYIFEDFCVAYPYAQLIDCRTVCCADEYVSGANINQVFLKHTASMRQCSEDLWVAEEELGTGNDLLTYVGALDRIQNPYKNFTYVGCIVRDLAIDLTAPGGSSSSGILSVQEDTDSENSVCNAGICLNETVLTAGDEGMEIRIWDLSPGCYYSWYYVEPVTGPVGSGVGSAVYCEDQAACGSISVTHGTTSRGYPVDNFFKQSMCLGDPFIRSGGILANYSEFANSALCKEKCLEDGAALALISPSNCACGSPEALYKSSPKRDSCDPCPESDPDDQDPPECGHDDLSLYTSVYTLDDSLLASSDYKYWQCVGNPLSNPPEQVLDDNSLRRLNFTVEIPGDCINECEADGFPIALVHSPDPNSGPSHGPRNFSCSCLTLYKFRYRIASQSRSFIPLCLVGVFPLVSQ